MQTYKYHKERRIRELVFLYRHETHMKIEKLARKFHMEPRRIVAIVSSMRKYYPHDFHIFSEGVDKKVPKS